MAIYESLEYLFCYNEEKTETSKLRKLVTRAHRLARNALGSDASTRNSVTESTGLLTEEIPMQTFTSGQGSRSENSRSYRSSIEEGFGSTSTANPMESNIERETNLDNVDNSNNTIPVTSANVEKSKNSKMSVVGKIINSLFGNKKEKARKYMLLEDCDNSSEEDVIFDRMGEVNTDTEQKVSVHRDSLSEEDESVDFDHASVDIDHTSASTSHSIDNELHDSQTAESKERVSTIDNK